MVMYDHMREKFLSGQLAWRRDALRQMAVVLLRDGYTPDPAHTTMEADVPDAAVIRSFALTGAHAEGPNAKANQVVMVGLPAGEHVVALLTVIVTEDVRHLVTHHDADLTTDGGDVTLTWPDGEVFGL